MSRGQFPSLRGRAFIRIIEGLGYTCVRRNGSHRRYEAPGRQPITVAFHDNADIPPGLVRSILTRQVGLTIEEALEVVRNA